MCQKQAHFSLVVLSHQTKFTGMSLTIIHVTLLYTYQAAEIGKDQSFDAYLEIHYLQKWMNDEAKKK